MTVLNPAPGFEVDIDDWAPATTAILGKKRTGKSNAATVIAEEMWDAGAHWVLIDPKGDAWGMRKAADGVGPGLPVPIFGGLHADLPLDETMGDFIADLVYDQQLTCILDISRFESKAARARFLTTFAKRIYRRHQEGKRVLNIILDEAHQVVPEVGRADEGMIASIGAWTDVVAMGGSLGLGVTLISQRSASIAKSVLSQIEVLIILRTASKLDRDAIKGWLEHQEVSADVQTSMHRLANGEAWVVSGYLNLGARVTFRMRRTFDSAATPKVGEKTKRVTLDDLDVDGIKSAMGDLAEKVTDDDPKKLRARINKLEKELAARPAAEPVVTEVARPFVPPEAVDLINLCIRFVDDATTFGREAMKLKREVPAETTVPGAVKPPPPRVTPVDARSPSPARALLASHLPASHRKVLTALAQVHPAGLTSGQLTTRTGYRYSGGFRNILSALRTSGYLAGGNGDTMFITEAGLEALGEYDPLPSGTALLGYWINEVGKDSSAAAALRHLVEVYPGVLTGPDLAEAIGYSYSGGFRNSLSTLRTLELIAGTNTAGMTAHPDFIESIT